MYKRSERTGLGIAEDRLEVRCAARGNVGDNSSNVVIGARAACAETLQPGIDGCDDGTSGPLQVDLEKGAGVETVGLGASSDGKDSILTLSRDATVREKVVRPLREIVLRTVDWHKPDLSKCTANNRSNKEKTSKKHD